jgi:hypothetical protein
MFPPELERDAFQTANGEFGWTREQIPLIVEVFARRAIPQTVSGCSLFRDALLRTIQLAVGRRRPDA